MIRGRKASIQLQVPSMSKPKIRKKPKYFSLKLQLSTATSKKKNKAEISQEKKKEEANGHKVTKLKDIHNSVDLSQDDHVAFLFETATDAASTTLDGLLDSSKASEERDHPLSPPLSCVLYSYQLSPHLRGGSLLRAAMRNKEREASEEERWVSYNEVVEGRSIKKEREEVTSCCGIEKNDEQVQLVVGWLKLDNYQEILDAWSNKDPFCLGGVHAGGGEDDLSNPQLVPHLHGASSVWLEGWRSNVANLWKVPEVEADIQAMEKHKEEEGLKWEHREASMMRYKKKRQSRLFAKRIQYQVRKLNAEKRPRIKGRFVKRSEQT